jgi:HSP20 family protein
MAIIKQTYRKPALSPWRDFGAEFNRLSRLFDDAGFPAAGSGMWTPAVNITETKEELLLTAEVPGMTEENIGVEIENNVLSISGEKTDVHTDGDEERRYHLWERNYGAFRRAFTLPTSVKVDDVTANFENGILTIRLPKVPEAKGRRIEIARSSS